MSTTATSFPSGLRPEELPAQNSTLTSRLSHKKVLDILNNKCGHSPQHLRQAHAMILRTGHFQDHYVSGTLVKCYANPYFNDFALAIRVFHHIPSPNVFVWNIILKGCLENNDPDMAISSYKNMLVFNSRPNNFTYPTLLKACALAGSVEEGIQFHAHVVKHGLSGDGHIKSAGIQMYSSFGLVKEARKILDDKDGESDVICWNAMIDGYLKCGLVEAAREVFESMAEKNVGSWNAMISGLARCGMIDCARKLFDDMSDRDEISWSAIIDGYVKEGCFKEALEVFNEMQRQNIRPRKYILASMLTACANLGALDLGRWINSYMERNFIQMEAVLGTALVDMYAKCGRLDMAWEVFENIPVKEVSTWNAMIGGLASHGQADEAIKLFTKMNEEKLKPNGITFVGVLNACAHAGMVDRGLALLHSMKEVYGIEHEIEHYGCVVDLLGRAGLLEEAEKFIDSMPMEPNAAVWGALLNACRIHRNVELGEKVGWILLDMEPQNSGRYTLLSNIYAKAERWDDVARVRKLMKERRIKTIPGSTMMDLGGAVHEFKMGDGSHPQTKEIYSMLESIMEKLRAEGYSPKTSGFLRH
ncbi:pentatricopeptide repeat-containing protein At5g66520-like [Prosopis cineraria]|uniref:pentatricopeptide repeat-containing protein At5g66520-like n=1 Tax=Prosopis cineraria TaxID=364024 RepID=UPI00240ED419|nr:pentatricopeptide repeat-containing protein At5g66520-like [Prosopis cineraria]XP_054804284.1 pentatricopeptide repeat-containing protein At5g66520-like [Prosopis cineraria]